MKNKACFLDRDGVLNVEVDYLHETEKLVIENGVIEALKILQQHNFKLLVVTNQAGVAKGFYSIDDVEKIHAEMAKIFAEAGVKIDKFYYCPHHPDYTGKCNCRKPLPGMILQGAEEFDIDLKSSCMIGDRITDIQAGIAAGCGQNILLLSGYGKNTVKENDCTRIPIAENLLDAVRKYIVKS
ncbi:MAG: D-glycero-beta-D-manno-heptose 1,7-bisphosphate 7-phosphatase [Lentisphaeria bacterium]|nr:D-glycero-beta-D-manno-heptose 1,7-bisphosphate 7-phosphatase [Lentisphaeria bacterium]